MALSSENQYLASDFIALKARVKAEMLRRKYKGTLVSYGSSAYDYTVTPQTGDNVLPEHINKIVTPLNAIKFTGINEVQSGDAFVDVSVLDAFLTTAEGYSLTSKSTDCNASCTGLCLTTCGTSCSGCSGSCSSTCGASCASDCTSTCSATCRSSCDNNNCRNGCRGSCTGGCTATCASDCTGGCKGGCKGGCTGCSTGCQGTCKGDCSSTCGVQAR